MTSSAGHERVDLRGVAAQVGHRVAHGGEVDDGGHAGEVLQQHARGREGDLLARLGLGVPASRAPRCRPPVTDAVLVAQQVLEQDLQREGQPRDVVLRLQRVEAEDRRARARRPSACRGRRSEFGMLGHGQGPFRSSSGSSTKGSPSGVVSDAEVVGRRSAMRSRAQPAGERDERRVRRGRATGWRRAMRERLVHRVGPPAHGVGAAVEVVPQRLACAGPPPRRRRRSPSRPRRAAWSRGPRRASRSSRRRRSWSGSARVVERDDDVVSRTTVILAEALASSCPSRAGRSGRRRCEDADVRLGPPRLLHRARRACGG